jgi:hypothetical protein
MAPLKNVLFDLERMKGAKNAVRRGLVAFRNFLDTVHLDIGPFGLDMSRNRVWPIRAIWNPT